MFSVIKSLFLSEFAENALIYTLRPNEYAIFL